MKSILTTIILGSLLCIQACNNGGAGSANTSITNYEQNKMSLEEQERANPLQFLSTDGTYRGVLIGTNKVLNGTVTNSATIAIFKDVEIQVHFYAKTGTEIKSANYMIYDEFPPGKSKPFTMRIEAPSQTKTIGWDIVKASAK